MDNMSPKPPKPPSDNNQSVVALAIVAALVVLGVMLVIAGLLGGPWAIITGTIGTIVGALATALNAPSGIGNVISAAKAPQPEATKETT